MPEYETRNLYFAAFLVVCGCKYLRTEWRGDYAVFLFEDMPRSVSRELRDSFFRDEGQVKALSYSQALKDLKRDLALSRK